MSTVGYVSGDVIMLTRWSRKRSVRAFLSRNYTKRERERERRSAGVMDGRKSVDSWFGGCRPTDGDGFRREWVLRLIGGVRGVALMRVRPEIFKFSDRAFLNLRLPGSSHGSLYHDLQRVEYARCSPRVRG